MDTLNMNNDEDKFNKILVELNDVISSLEKYIDDEEIVRTFLKTLVINIDDKNNLLLYIKCNKDRFKEVLNKNKLFALHKYADLVLSLSDMKQDSCKDYMRPEDIESINVISIAKEMGLSDKDIEIFFRKRLGEKISIKDFITDNLREEMFNEYVRRFINSVNRDCKSSYCVAMKLSSLWDILRDRSDILDWDPKVYFRRALFRKEVINNAIKWPVIGLIDDVSRPHFRSLWTVKDIITEWVNMINLYRTNKKPRMLSEPSYRKIEIKRKEKELTESSVTRKTKESKVKEKEKIYEHKRRIAKQKMIVLAIVVALAVFLTFYIGAKAGFITFINNDGQNIETTTTLSESPLTPLTTHSGQVVHTYTTSTTQGISSVSYYIVDLENYMVSVGVNKANIFIDAIPSSVKINDVPFKIYFEDGESFERDVRVLAGEKIYISIDPPQKVDIIHLLTAMHYICSGDIKQGSVVAKIVVVHQDGTLEIFNITAGIDTDEWRRGYDSEKCHPYPWLSPAVSGKMIYISVDGVRINSTWNLYYTAITLENDSPIEKIIILDANKDLAGLSVYAMTFQRNS